MDDGIDEAYINETIHIATKIVGYMYLKTFRQQVLRAIFQTQI
jgi:hypothetical protein